MWKRVAVVLLVFAGAAGAAAAQGAPPGPAGPGGAPGLGHGFLIDTHLKAGLQCASCHQESPPAKAVEMPQCLTCHGSYADLAAKTDTGGLGPNPHGSHMGQVPCSSCHRVHAASVLMCSQCHQFDMKTP